MMMFTGNCWAKPSELAYQNPVETHHALRSGAVIGVDV